MLLLLAQYFAQRWIVERIIFIEYLSNILKGNKHLSLFEPDKYLLDVHCSVIVIFLHFFCLYRHAIFIKYWCYDLCCEKDSQKEATISKKNRIKILYSLVVQSSTRVRHGFKPRMYRVVMRRTDYDKNGTWL